MDVVGEEVVVEEVEAGAGVVVVVVVVGLVRLEGAQIDSAILEFRVRGG